MNVEEARRAAIRREEDNEWIHLLQVFERNRGDIIRRQQRAKAEAQKKNRNETRTAAYSLSVARAQAEQDARQDEEMQHIREREERYRRDRQSAAANRSRRAQKLRQQQAEDAAWSAKQLENERRRLEQAEAARQRKLETERLYHERQAAAHAPILFDCRSEAELLQLKEANAERVRKAEAEKERERQALELKRLQNILKARQRQEIEATEHERREAALIAAAEEKAKAQDESQARVREEHYLVLERSRQKQIAREERNRLLERARSVILPPVSRSPERRAASAVMDKPEADANDQFSRLAKTRELARLKQELAKHQRAAEEAALYHERHRQEEEARKHQHVETIKQKQAKCTEHLLQQRSERMADVDLRLKEDLEAAEARRRRDEAEQASFVTGLKQYEKDCHSWVEHKLKRRKEDVRLNAAKARLEAAELRDLLASRANEKKMFDTAESERVTRNRRRAVEKLRLKELHDREEAAVLRAQDDERRRRALDQQEQLRAHRVEELARHQSIRCKDAEHERQWRRAQQLEVTQTSDAYYHTHQSPKRKERVPIAARRTEEVVLPPHPELASLEADTQAFLDGVLKDLSAADVRAKQIERQRI